MTNEVFNKCWGQWCGLWPKGSRTPESYFEVLNGRLTDYELKQITKRLPVECEHFPTIKIILALGNQQPANTTAMERDPDCKPFDECSDEELRDYYQDMSNMSEYCVAEFQKQTTETGKLMWATMQRLAHIAGAGAAMEYHKRKPGLHLATHGKEAE